MEDLTILATTSNNNIFGEVGGLLWNLPENKLHFDEITSGKQVIMDVSTYEILEKSNTLNNIIPIIMSDKYEPNKSAYFVKNVQEALSFTKCSPSYIVGQVDLYKKFFSSANKISLNIIDSFLDKGQAFPEITNKEWELTNEELHKHEGRFHYIRNFKRK
jgi:dihydrofolate reductase